MVARITFAKGGVMEFEPFQKIARLSRNCVITEKIDGTNACIAITADGKFFTGSRTRWITPSDDNFGFATWAHEHREELLSLGVGRHFGEWWGLGIQRNYGQSDRLFSLFNASRWTETPPPACCSVVPVLYSGSFTSAAVDDALAQLRNAGSAAAPGFMKPEGVIVYHLAARQYFKKTLDKDEEWKGKPK